MSKLLCDYCRQTKPEHHKDCPAIHHYALEMYEMLKWLASLERMWVFLNSHNKAEDLLKEINGE